MMDENPSSPAPTDEVGELVERLTVHSEYVLAEGVFQMRNVTASILSEAASTLSRLRGERDERSDLLDAERARFDAIHDALESRADKAEDLLREISEDASPNSDGALAVSSDATVKASLIRTARSLLSSEGGE